MNASPLFGHYLATRCTWRTLQLRYTNQVKGSMAIRRGKEWHAARSSVRAWRLHGNAPNSWRAAFHGSPYHVESELPLPKRLRRLGFSDSGQGLVEYSLLISVVALGLMAVLLVLRNSTGNVYDDARNSVDQAIACSGGTSTACPAGGGVGASTGTTTAGNGQAASGTGHGGNGQGNNGTGNGNGGGNGSNGKGGGKGNSP